MSSTATAPYVQVASAPGAWWCPLYLPLEPYEEVRARVKEVAHELQVSISAAARGRGGNVGELILLRDPSVIHGAVDVAEAEAVAARLVDRFSWLRKPSNWRYPREPLADAVVPLGLRRGFAFDAPVHPESDARDLLARHAPGARAWSARLFSVRPASSRTSHEPGLLVHVDPACLGGVGVVADELGQERWPVTDWQADVTRAMKRS